MDKSLLLALQHSAHPVWDRLFTWLSDQMTFALPLLILLACLAVLRFRLNGLKAWGLIIPLIFISDTSGNMLKSHFQHLRPCQEIWQQLHFPENQPPLPCGTRPNGMPSSHALNFFAVSTAIYVITRHPAGLALFAVATAVGISRIYLGKHYPSQVLAGGLIGVVIGWLYAWICLRYFHFLRTMGPANRKHSE